MRSRRHGVAGLLLIGIAATLLGACGVSAPTPIPVDIRWTGATQVDAVRVVLTSGFPQNHVLPFDKTSTNAAQAQRVWDALMALPPYPSGVMNCPADFDEQYHLTFYERGAVVGAATVKPDGCEGATPPDGSARWAATDPAFWATLATALRVSPAELLQPARLPGP